MATTTKKPTDKQLKDWADRVDTVGQALAESALQAGLDRQLAQHRESLVAQLHGIGQEIRRAI